MEGRGEERTGTSHQFIKGYNRNERSNSSLSAMRGCKIIGLIYISGDAFIS